MFKFWHDLPFASLYTFVQYSASCTQAFTTFPKTYLISLMTHSLPYAHGGIVRSFRPRGSSTWAKAEPLEDIPALPTARRSAVACWTPTCSQSISVEHVSTAFMNKWGSGSLLSTFSSCCTWRGAGTKWLIGFLWWNLKCFSALAGCKGWKSPRGDLPYHLQKPPVTHTMAIPNPTAALSSAATCPVLCPPPWWDSGAPVSSQLNHRYQWWNSSWLQVVPTYATANWEQTQLRNRGATFPSSPSYLPGTQSSLSLPSHSPWLQQHHDLSLPFHFQFWFGLFKTK